MKQDSRSAIIRLRIGVLLLFIWWIPLWIIGPQIAKLLGVDPNHTRITIMVIQTIIGFIGGLLVGKQVAVIIKKTSFRKMPRTIWHALIHGSLD